MGKALGRKAYQTVQNSFLNKLGVLPQLKKKGAVNQMKLVVLIYCLVLAWKVSILEG